MGGTPVGEQREWACAELVELVTEYYEGALPTAGASNAIWSRARRAAHTCRSCVT
jgi:hypothetical protein